MNVMPRQRGMTLIELIVFIVIVGVALTGVLTVLNHTVRHSAIPLIRKQALAIAVETVAGNTDTRPSNTSPFDNVNDYHGLTTTTNIAGGGAAVYTASVTVEETALNGLAASEALLVAAPAAC